MKLTGKVAWKLPDSIRRKILQFTSTPANPILRPTKNRSPYASTPRRCGAYMPRRDIIVIGASAGGIHTLSQILEYLPADLPASLFVVVHIPATSAGFLPQILNRTGPLKVKRAENDEPIRRG